jgi:hypothetical protein
VQRGTPTEADVVSREELYEWVWSVPMIKVAKIFKVSGSYLQFHLSNVISVR